MKKSKLFSPDYLFWSLIAIVGAVMFLFNCLTPFVADDFTFAFSFSTGQPLTGITDVLQSQIHHYFNWSGRFIIKALDQWFTVQPKLLFNICNTLVYLGLALMVYLTAKGRKAKKDPLLLLLIFFSFWMIAPVFGQTNLWMCGSFNYLWASFFCFAAAVPYLLYLHASFSCRWLPIGAFFLGLVGGWSSENTSAGLLVLIVLVLAWFLFTEKKAPLWMFTGFAGSLLGFALLVLAPGNYQRQDTAPDSRGFLTILSTRFLSALNMLWEHGLALLLIFAALYWLLWQQKASSKQLFLPIALLLAGLGANFAMVLSPVYYPRSSHGVFVFLTAACAACLAQLDIKALRPVLGACAACLTVTACFQFLYAGYDILSFSMMHKTREALLLEEKAQGASVVESYSIEPYTRWCAGYGLPDLRPDADNWISRDMARYYGFERLYSTEAHTYPFPGRTNDAFLSGLPDEPE